MKCQSAGIKVIMMTGDHPITAKSIARAVNIISEDSKTAEEIAERLSISPELMKLSDAKACVSHGNDLRNKTSAEIDTLLNDYTEIVFARISPQQNATVVEGEYDVIVTMIGDDVSDLPALQQADFAVVMGSFVFFFIISNRLIDTHRSCWFSYK